jgi:hypothetical protein
VSTWILVALWTVWTLWSLLEFRGVKLLVDINKARRFAGLPAIKYGKISLSFTALWIISSIFWISYNIFA